MTAVSGLVCSKYAREAGSAPLLQTNSAPSNENDENVPPPCVCARVSMCVSLCAHAHARIRGCVRACACAYTHAAIIG